MSTISASPAYSGQSNDGFTDWSSSDGFAISVTLAAYGSSEEAYYNLSSYLSALHDGCIITEYGISLSGPGNTGFGNDTAVLLYLQNTALTEVLLSTNQQNITGYTPFSLSTSTTTLISPYKLKTAILWVGARNDDTVNLTTVNIENVQFYVNYTLKGMSGMLQFSL